MIETMHGTKPVPTEADLAAMEARIGVTLPESYRRFLLRYNGGTPEPDNYSDEAGHRARLHSFFHLPPPDAPATGEPRDLDDLYGILDCYQGETERVPRDVLPIGADEGGNLICLGIRGEHRGAVFFWDHEKDGIEDEEEYQYNRYHAELAGYTLERESSLTRIQADFPGFLSSFHIYEPDPLEDAFTMSFFGTQNSQELEDVLDTGFSPDYVLPVYDMTVIEYCAYYRQPEKLELFLRRGARKNLANALRLAEQRGNDQCAAIIRSYQNKDTE